MALRKGHGRGKGVPRIEVLPADELPAPIPVAPAKLPEQCRRENGTIASSETAKEIGRRGGLARAQKKRLLQGIGLVNLVEDNTFTPYYRAAMAWLDAELAVYAQMCGGVLGPGPSTLYGNAAICLAMSRYLADKGYAEQNELHTRQSLRYMDAMKQQKLAAYELAVREAKMRAELNENDPFDAFEEALRRQAAGEEDQSSE